MEKLLYTGKAKQMWQTEDPDVLRVVYLDQATMLNGKRKDHFDGKGEAANDISTLVFEYLIDNGIPTHFIKRLSEKEELVNGKLFVKSCYYRTHIFKNRQAYNRTFFSF